MLVEHHIDIGNLSCHSTTSIWLPWVLVDVVRMEIDEMLKHGITEPSKKALGISFGTSEKERKITNALC